MEKRYIEPQFPMRYGVSSDPHGDNNLMYTDMTGWIMAPNFKIMVDINVA